VKEENPLIVADVSADKAKSAVPKWTVCLCLALVTAAIYAPVRHYEFVNLDDNQYVTEQPQVLRGLSFAGVRWAFTSLHFCNWHPLTTLSHMLDCELWGLNAGGHHLTNVFFHVANTVLLFLVLQGMSGALWRSAFVAALFAWHPLHVESVAWISDRKDVLSMFFLILTLAAYLWYVRRPRWHRYLLVFTCYMLGLMSKATLVTMPLLLLLLDYWPLGRLCFGGSIGLSRPLPVLIREKLPFCVLAGVFGVVAFLAQQSGGAVSALEKMSFLDRVSNASLNYIAYLLKTPWPTDLAVPYPMRPEIPPWKVLGSGLALSLAAILVVRATRRSPFLAFGWFWYLLALLPVIGLVQIGAQTMADRYTYTPLIGLFIMISWGSEQVLEGLRPGRTIVALSAVSVLALCVAGTARQLQYWRNSELLCTHALACSSENYFAHNNLGLTMVDQGRFAEAISHFQRAVEIRPDYAEAYYNLGIALDRQGNPVEAMNQYQKALEIKPDYAEAHNNLGILLTKQGRAAEAIEQYQRAIELDPNRVEFYNNMGNLLATRGHLVEATANYQKAVEINPDFAAAHCNLGNALALQSKYTEAIGHYQRALQLRPDDAMVRQSLDAVLIRQSQSMPGIPKPSNP